jgi:hypothetical protein
MLGQALAQGLPALAFAYCERFSIGFPVFAASVP